MKYRCALSGVMLLEIVWKPPVFAPVKTKADGILTTQDRFSFLRVIGPKCEALDTFLFLDERNFPRGVERQSISSS